MIDLHAYDNPSDMDIYLKVPCIKRFLMRVELKEDSKFMSLGQLLLQQVWPHSMHTAYAKIKLD